MEEATPTGESVVYTTLLDLFGRDNDSTIRQAISIASTSNAEPNLETAIDIMFELINQQQDEIEKTPPKKPSRASSVETGAKKKTFAMQAQSNNVGLCLESASNQWQEKQAKNNVLGDIKTPKAKFLPPEYKKAIDLIGKGFKVMILLRGLPGSGKSFLANEVNLLNSININYLNFD